MEMNNIILQHHGFMCPEEHHFYLKFKIGQPITEDMVKCPVCSRKKPRNIEHENSAFAGFGSSPMSFGSAPNFSGETPAFGYTPLMFGSPPQTTSMSEESMEKECSSAKRAQVLGEIHTPKQARKILANLGVKFPPSEAKNLVSLKQRILKIVALEKGFNQVQTIMKSAAYAEASMSETPPPYISEALERKKVLMSKLDTTTPADN